MGGILDRIKNWWEVSSPMQRYATIGGAVVTLLLLIGVFSFASRPKYALLYGGLNQTDQAAIVTELQALGVPVKYDLPGQIEVPSDKVADLRMKLVSAGKVPKSAHMGTENLADMTLTTTPAVERERLKAILEGELARSIETNPGVRAARVHITLGDPSPFADQQRPPTASISLITTGPGSVTRESAKGIAMLVANSVDGMELKSVVVLDEKSQSLFNGGEMNGADSVAINKLELEQLFARKEEQRIQTNLDSIFGIGATKVSVRCEVDLDEKRVKENKRIVAKGAAVKSMKESMSGDSAVGGASGATANVEQAGASRDNEGGENYTSKVEQIEPNITETSTETNKSMGAMKSMVINVAANVGRFTPEQQDKRDEFVNGVRDFVQTEIANYEGQAGFVARVTEVAFDETAKTRIDTAQAEAKSSAQMQQLLSLLPIFALLVVGIMVVKQFSKITKQQATIVTPDGQLLTVPLVNGQIPSHYALASTDGSESRELVKASPDDLVNSLAAGDEERLGDSIVFRGEDEVIEVDRIKEKKSAHLSAIKQMAKERPEPTALLIKTWISEEKR